MKPEVIEQGMHLCANMYPNIKKFLMIMTTVYTMFIPKKKRINNWYTYIDIYNVYLLISQKSYIQTLKYNTNHKTIMNNKI